MELRHLRAFAALADQLHFGRAAARLGITQSALSQQIARLEKELGVTLVKRTSRETTLTSIGELYLPSVLRTISEVDRGLGTIREAAEGWLGRLVIGCVGAGVNGPLPGYLSAFRRLAPHHVIELHHSLDSAAQERELLTGSLDLALVRSIVNEQSLVAHKLFDEPFAVFVPTSHPLASRDLIGLSELRDEGFVFWLRAAGPSYYDLVMSACHAAGFTPRIEAHGNSLEAQLGLVAAEAGVLLQSASNGSVSREGVTMIPLHPQDIVSPLWLAYRRWHRNSLVDVFLQAAGLQARSR